MQKYRTEAFFMLTLAGQQVDTGTLGHVTGIQGHLAGQPGTATRSAAAADSSAAVTDSSTATAVGLAAVPDRSTAATDSLAAAADSSAADNLANGSLTAVIDGLAGSNLANGSLVSANDSLGTANNSLGTANDSLKLANGSLLRHVFHVNRGEGEEGQEEEREVAENRINFSSSGRIETSSPATTAVQSELKIYHIKKDDRYDGLLRLNDVRASKKVYKTVKESVASDRPKKKKFPKRFPPPRQKSPRKSEEPKPPADFTAVAESADQVPRDRTADEKKEEEEEEDVDKKRLGVVKSKPPTPSRQGFQGFRGRLPKLKQFSSVRGGGEVQPGGEGTALIPSTDPLKHRVTKGDRKDGTDTPDEHFVANSGGGLEKKRFGSMFLSRSRSRDRKKSGGIEQTLDDGVEKNDHEVPRERKRFGSQFFRRRRNSSRSGAGSQVDVTDVASIGVETPTGDGRKLERKLFGSQIFKSRSNSSTRKSTDSLAGSIGTPGLGGKQKSLQNLPTEALLDDDNVTADGGTVSAPLKRTTSVASLKDLFRFNSRKSSGAAIFSSESQDRLTEDKVDVSTTTLGASGDIVNTPRRKGLGLGIFSSKRKNTKEKLLNSDNKADLDPLVQKSDKKVDLEKKGRQNRFGFSMFQHKRSKSLHEVPQAVAEELAQQADEPLNSPDNKPKGALVKRSISSASVHGERYTKLRGFWGRRHPSFQSFKQRGASMESLGSVVEEEVGEFSRPRYGNISKGIFKERGLDTHAELRKSLRQVNRIDDSRGSIPEEDFGSELTHSHEKLHSEMEKVIQKFDENTNLSTSTESIDSVKNHVLSYSGDLKDQNIEKNDKAIKSNLMPQIEDNFEKNVENFWQKKEVTGTNTYLSLGQQTENKLEAGYKSKNERYNIKDVEPIGFIDEVIENDSTLNLPYSKDAEGNNSLTFFDNNDSLLADRNDILTTENKLDVNPSSTLFVNEDIHISKLTEDGLRSSQSGGILQSQTETNLYGRDGRTSVERLSRIERRRSNSWSRSVSVETQTQELNIKGFKPLSELKKTKKSRRFKPRFKLFRFGRKSKKQQPRLERTASSVAVNTQETQPGSAGQLYQNVSSRRGSGLERRLSWRGSRAGSSSSINLQEELGFKPPLPGMEEAVEAAREKGHRGLTSLQRQSSQKLGMAGKYLSPD